MKKILLSITMLLSFTLTSTAFAILPNEAFTFDVNIEMISMSKTRENKIYEAAEIIKEVVASEQFKDAVLGHTYAGKKQFADNGGLNNSQIYQRILSGAEKLKPLVNNAMDLEVELYTDLKSQTVGFTKTNHHRVWVNTKYFNIFGPASVASNLMHEWLHKLGFSHAVKKTKSRKYSVPYAIGKMIRKIGKKLRR